MGYVRTLEYLYNGAYLEKVSVQHTVSVLVDPCEMCVISCGWKVLNDADKGAVVLQI